MLAQLGVLLVVTGLSFWLNARLASDQLNEQYEDRATAVAQTVADTPQVIQALSRTGPASAVQPIALKVAHSTGAVFVVVVNRNGIRFSDPNPARVGKWFGQAVASLDGRVHVRVNTAASVPNAQATVPVSGAGGAVIGQVSVGYMESQVAGAVSRVLPTAAAAAGAALLLGVVVSFITGGHNVATLVLETGRSARIDDAATITGEITSLTEKLGVRSVVGVPIEVGGRVWGLISVSTTRPEPMAMETEHRIVGFTKLAAAAIANAQARADLADSRRRVVSAADEMRRKIERNLHDGSQQRLVTLSMELREICDSYAGVPELRGKLAHTAEELSGLLGELREISHGLHPAILSEAGLQPALKSLARRSALPVKLHVDAAGRLPEPVEVGAYYVVSEALTNAAKHSRASVVEVTIAVSDDMLHVRVRDDGVGGADLTRGSGIVGLRDRVESLDGTITVDSPPGQGTVITAEIPLALNGRQSALHINFCPPEPDLRVGLHVRGTGRAGRVDGLPGRLWPNEKRGGRRARCE